MHEHHIKKNEKKIKEMRVGFQRVSADETPENHLILLKAKTKSTFAASEARINRIKTKFELLENLLSDLSFLINKTRYKLDYFDPVEMFNDVQKRKREAEEKYNEIMNENMKNETLEKQMNEEVDEMNKEEKELFQIINKIKESISLNKEKIQRKKAACLQLIFENELSQKQAKHDSAIVDEVNKKLYITKSINTSKTNKLEELNARIKEAKEEIRNMLFILSGKRAALYHFVKFPEKQDHENEKSVSEYEEECRKFDNSVQQTIQTNLSLQEKLKQINHELLSLQVANIQLEEDVKTFKKAKHDHMEHAEELENKRNNFDARQSRCDEENLYCRQEEIEVTCKKSRTESNLHDIKEQLSHLEEQVTSLENENKSLEEQIKEKKNQHQSFFRKPSKRTFLKINW